MELNNIKELMFKAIQASLEAGDEILNVYEDTFEVDFKEDNSPLTEADRKAHHKIVEILNDDVPILSEEGKEIPLETRKRWECFWMVDPLDGTKEFVKRNGEFTVNIALIHKNYPVAGVIYVPVKSILYVAISEMGSWKISGVLAKEKGNDFDEICGLGLKLKGDTGVGKFKIVGSRSHMSPETLGFIENQKHIHGDVEMVSMGSSLKLCLVAEGKANIYPRFAPTMEWDTAAGQAIAEGAGKTVVQYDTGDRLRYNKESLLNPWFIVK